jgi:hypothetical protein
VGNCNSFLIPGMAVMTRMLNCSMDFIVGILSIGGSISLCGQPPSRI